MKPIEDYKDLPKFLRVNHWQASQSYNKYLLKPYTEGEIVKVVEAEKQVPNDETMSIEFYRKRYVKIVRRDEDGKFTLNYVIQWQGLDYMKKTKEA